MGKTEHRSPAPTEECRVNLERWIFGGGTYQLDIRPGQPLWHNDRKSPNLDVTVLHVWQKYVLEQRLKAANSWRTELPTCCPLLKRCTSSRNRMVRLHRKYQGTYVEHVQCTNLPVNESSPLASSNTVRTSLMPVLVADSSFNTASVLFASNRARVVFPDPLGPHRIMLPAEP